MVYGVYEFEWSMVDGVYGENTQGNELVFHY
jgi:hypothetical protein